MGIKKIFYSIINACLDGTICVPHSLTSPPYDSTFRFHNKKKKSQDFLQVEM